MIDEPDHTLWTPAAWELYEAVLEAHGYYVDHCVHCSGRTNRGAAWGMPGHPHPTCIIWATALPPRTGLRGWPPEGPLYYLGC